MPYVAPSKDEYQTSGFGVLDEDEYLVSVESWEEKPNTSKYAKSAEAKTIWFYLKPIGFAHDPEAELVDEDGNELHPDKTLIFFYDPDRLGLIPQASKSRKFLAAVLQVPIEERIEFSGYEELVGKKLIVAVTSKDGQNRVTDVRPVPKKKVRQRAAVAPTSLTEKAQDILDVEPGSLTEEDEY